MPKINVWLIQLLLLVLAVILIVKISGLFKKPKIENIPVVNVVQARRHDFVESINLIGNIRPQKIIQISTPVSGVIAEIDFKSGQWVKKGAILISLEHAQEEAMVDEQQAEFDLAQKNYAKNLILYQSKTISQVDFEKYRAEWLEKKAQLQRAVALLEQKIIRAPFAGVLGIRQINLGQFIAPGEAIVSLQDPTHFYVDFNLPASFIPDIQMGSHILVQSYYQAQTYPAIIQASDLLCDPATRSLPMRALITNALGGLIAGQFVKVTLSIHHQNQAYIALPTTALTYNPLGAFVFVIHQQRASLHPVQVIKQIAGEVFLSQGVNAGDWVVDAGQQKLYDGSLVRVVHE